MEQSTRHPDSPGTGSAPEQQAGALPSAATRGQRLPLLERLLASRSQSSPDIYSFFQAQEPSPAGLAGGGKRSPHRTVSVPLPVEAGCRALTSGLSLCFQGAYPERKRGRGNGVASLATCGGPSLCSPASFRDQESQRASSLTRGCHSPCFFLLHPRARHPNRLHPEHRAHFLKTLDVTVFTGPTAHAGNSSSQI